MKGRYLATAGLVAALLLPSIAAATNGYFAHGYGTRNKGMAGAGVALPQDALAAATNPAGMAFVGHRIDLGAALFSPRRDYTVDGFPSGGLGTFPLEPGKEDSDSEYFLIPHFGWNRPINENTTFGVSVYGNGGMNTDYDNHANPVRGSAGQGDDPGAPGFNPCVPGAATKGTGTYCGGAAGVDLMQLFIAPTVASRVTDRLALGATAIIAYQRFEATGLANFAPFSTSPTKLTNNGHEDSFGFGARVGALFALTDTFDIGASYQSKISMEEFGDYKGLFAEKGDFDIPASATIGIAWQVNDRFTLVFDVQKTWHSDVDSVGNAFSNLFTCTGMAGGPDPAYCLGGNRGAGFGWDDVTTYKIGGQYESGDWTWRAGYSHADQPISSSEVLFNILAPAVIEDTITAGFTKKMAGGSELSFAAMYAFENDVKGPNPMEAPGQQEIELSMDQWELELSWTWFLD